ncbi:efflux RND transporter periplasmic adaptor subunit [Arundinibacter roseus]|uniref:Efflux RND transporter periplasmic adaptor subunit n=1 Tax=Arundinibacter roseus TaxID=2070510 RepID=A0A4R4KJ04_9BACT|nr:efflux RND transporter periplasmic adaptor subunit [Arundinibacter roseus]TDB68244.1 efflux RND transporter periplasmic adaptor subunit [Arundinibacter roseus]
MKKNLYPSAALSLPLLYVLMACGGSPEKPQQQQAPAAIPVATFRVEQGLAVSYDEYPATVQPLKVVEIRAMASGYVTGMYFSDGQQVRKGQRLYQIDQQQTQASVDQAVAALNVAESNERLAQKEADRYIELDKNEAIAKQLLDNALARLETAKLQVQAARASVQQLRSGLSYTTVNAPISGTIGISQVQMGGLVMSNQTLLNTLSTDDPMAVDFSVDQKEISRFSSLLKKGNVADSTFLLALPDGSVYPQTGRIELIDRSVDTQTGTIKTRLVFPNANGLLKAGMTVQVRVKSSTSGSSLLIPQKALVEQMGEYFVYVVKGDSVQQQQVKTGTLVNDRIVIQEGLTEGTEVVTEGIQKLKNGAKVQVTSVGATTVR